MQIPNTIAAGKENNNFNIIRIYLSLAVLLFHTHVLSRKHELSLFSSLFDADRAVQGFFIISGYLVIKSYLRSSSNKEFYIKRFRRIYPAYFTVIVLCSIFGVLVSTYSWVEYFMSPVLYKYMLANIFFLNFLQPSLPGVFEGNFLDAVNGSLWTLKIEVSFYGLVPLIIFLKRRMNAYFLYVLLFLLSAGFYFAMIYLYLNTHRAIFQFLSRQIPGQLFYFILGALIAELDARPWLRSLMLWLGLPCLVGLFVPLGVFAGSLALAVAIFFFAFCIPAINYPLKREDISYGLYIYHFPVIQVLVYYGIFNNSPLAGVILSLVYTIVLASLSWVFIEKPLIVKKTPLKIKAVTNG